MPTCSPGATIDGHGLASIIEDDRQRAGKHDGKHQAWNALGVPYLSRDAMIKLDFGDYMRGFEDGAIDPSANISVDTKSSLLEVSANLGRKYATFKREIARANAAGYLLVILIETDEAKCIEDVRGWKNTHCQTCNLQYVCDQQKGSVCMRHGTGKPLQGDAIACRMRAIELSHNVRFEFCRPQDSAMRICEILGVSHNGPTVTTRAGTFHA